MFNNVLWSFCPKEQFSSPLSASLADSLAVYIYNSGLQCTVANLMKKCNFSYSKKSVEQWHRMDNELAKVTMQYEKIEKKKRKLKKRSQIIQHDSFQKSEGVHYQPEGFHTNSKN